MKNSSQTRPAIDASDASSANSRPSERENKVHLESLSARAAYEKRFAWIQIRTIITCLVAWLMVAFCLRLAMVGEPLREQFGAMIILICFIVGISGLHFYNYVAEIRTFNLWIRCPNPNCGKGISTRLEWACGVCDAINTLPIHLFDLFDFKKQTSFVNLCGTCKDTPASVLCCHCGDKVVLISDGDHRHPARPMQLDERQEQSLLKQEIERKKLAEEVAKQQRDHVEEIKLRTETNKLLIVDAEVIRKRREAYLLAYPWLAESKSDPDKVMEKIVHEVVKGEMIVFRVLNSLLDSITEELKQGGVDEVETNRVKAALSNEY